ncbi:MAG: hypothetical protein ACHQ2Z_03110 [Elusimicrobiota bacterium]
MRYWLFDERTKRALGPHLALLLPKQPGFGPESKVAPEGARAPGDWRKAKDVDELKVLFTTPAAPPAEKPKG